MYKAHTKYISGIWHFSSRTCVGITVVPVAMELKMLKSRHLARYSITGINKRMLFYSVI
jgi:hypothetical protein